MRRSVKTLHMHTNTQASQDSTAHSIILKLEKCAKHNAHHQRLCQQSKEQQNKIKTNWMKKKKKTKRKRHKEKSSHNLKMPINLHQRKECMNTSVVVVAVAVTVAGDFFLLLLFSLVCELLLLAFLSPLFLSILHVAVSWSFCFYCCCCCC